MTDFPPFLQLLSRATVQALQMRCLTFSRFNWLRNGELSKAGEYIWRTLQSMGRVFLDHHSYQILRNIPTIMLIPSITFISFSQILSPSCLFQTSRLIESLEYTYKYYDRIPSHFVFLLTLFVICPEISIVYQNLELKNLGPRL